MTLLQILPSVSELPHREKLQLMRWLVEQLIQEEAVLSVNTEMEHAVWSPYNSFEAAVGLGAFLEQAKASRQS